MDYNDRIYDIPVDEIEVDYNWNTRDFNQMDCAELRKAIKDAGQKEAGKVMHQPNKEKPYFLIAGFRRMHVVRDLLKLPTYRAIVIPECSETEMLKYTFSENHGRKDLTIYDESMVMERFYAAGYSEAMVQTELGLSRGYTQPRFMLIQMMNADPELIPLAKSGQLNASMCRKLYSIKSVHDRKEAVKELAQKAKFKLKLKLDPADYETKKPRDTMLMERKKPHRQAFMEWTLGNGVPFHYWPEIIAWINGDKNDLELIDTLNTMISDPCCYAEFSELIENAETYTTDPEGFLASVLSFKEDVEGKTIQRPDNGIPTGS